jgi:ubiquinone/menaquinone biosynthesis C-methylase UbiE
MSAAEKISRGTTEQVIDYYQNAQSYLLGPLQGACHFGYSDPDDIRKKQGSFELTNSLRAMERLLGDRLDLPPYSTVVDAGCGYGRVATTLADEFGLRIIGADLIPKRLSEARQFTNVRGVGNRVGLVNANYAALPLQDSSVDGLYTIETLVHADQLEPTLAEFKRVLRPGGRLVHFEYSVPDPKSLGAIRRKITDEMVQRTGMTSVERLTHGSYPDHLQNAGFENVEVEDISRNVWPSWRWLFWRSVHRDVPRVLSGQAKANTNLLGALCIWPYRNQLRYNVVTATKPEEDISTNE